MEETSPHEPRDADGRHEPGGTDAARAASDQHDPRAYVRAAATIREQIACGRLRPGDPVPSITVLARERGISRNTVGKALRLLEREGLIFRVPGLGYHVTRCK